MKSKQPNDKSFHFYVCGFHSYDSLSWNFFKSLLWGHGWGHQGKVLELQNAKHSSKSGFGAPTGGRLDFYDRVMWKNQLAVLRPMERSQAHPFLKGSNLTEDPVQKSPQGRAVIGAAR